METIQSAASEVLVNLFVAVIGLLAAHAMYYINRAAGKLKAQTAQIRDEEARKVLENALADTEHLASVTVAAIEQTAAKSIRDAVRDGQVDRAELEALGKRAFVEIKSKVGPAAQAAITKNLGGFDDYLTALIEAKVLEVKTSTWQ